ncbi:MAG: hypothetical protein R2762_26380 [Bryobacteraceae bacterium]
MRCLRVNPKARFRHAADVLTALETGSRATLRWRMMRREARRAARSPLFAAAVTLVLLASAALWFAGRSAPSPAGSAAWDRSIASPHGVEPLIAARQLEQAMAAHRLPVRAHVDLALAWAELDLPERARQELSRLPYWLSRRDRVYAEAARARLRGDRAAGLRLLAGLAGSSPADLTLEADRAWFGAGPGQEKDRWAAIAARRPEHAAAHLQLAKAAAAEDKWRSAERPRAPSGAGAGPCERVVVLTVGEADNFAAPPDPVPTSVPRWNCSRAAEPGGAGDLTTP